MAHEEAVFSNQHSAVSEKQNQHQHQRPFTAKPLHGADAEDAKEEKSLSRADGKPGDEEERVQQRAEALAHKLAQTYEELTRLLERNPGVKRQITEGESREDKVYQKLKRRLKMADMAPRCQWVRQDGTSCRSPQMKRHIYCFAHMQMAEARALMLRLPPPEDANAIQIGIMRIQKAMLEGTISTKMAGLLLYSMQLALTNVGRTTFGQAKDEEMVRETVSEEEAFSENRKPLTTKETKDTGEEKGLPQMDADDRGWQGEERSRDIEFVHVPGGYGFERVRLRIDSSGHRAVPAQPADHREIGTPPRAAVPHEHAPHEHAEVHANLG
jgi:hypothetical protein